MRYLFILGRNIELSTAEVKSFLRKEGINFSIISQIKNGLLVDSKNRLPEKIIEKFGGVVSIGEVLFSWDSEINIKEVFTGLNKIDLYSGVKNKLNYVVFNFNSEYFDDILSYLKNRFKTERLKATEKKLTGTIRLQNGEYAPNVSSKLVNEQYFIFENNFGKIIEKTDYEKIEERDMKKPIRRSELSISPRLAKILINLSEVKKGEKLLDPFSGVGVILEEALLQGIKVIGIDIDKIAVDSAKTNLKWFGFDKENYNLVNTDSSKFSSQRVDAIATEPDFGELKKTRPSLEEAKKIVQKFEKLIIKVLKNLKNNVEGKVVFTAPLVLVSKKKVSCNFELISKQAGLKIIEGPINEFRKDSIIGRSIIVMKK